MAACHCPCPCPCQPLLFFKIKVRPGSCRSYPIWSPWAYGQFWLSNMHNTLDFCFRPAKPPLKAQTYLQPHCDNGVFSNVYLSAGQHLDINIALLHFAASRGHLAMYEFFACWLAERLMYLWHCNSMFSWTHCASSAYRKTSWNLLETSFLVTS